MSRAYINIGSNIGDRLKYIDQAVAAIEQRLCTRAIRSSVIESEPWGYDSPNRYMNLGIAVDFDRYTSLELHRILQNIERGIDSGSHRQSDGSYADRAIDVDLIAVDDEIIDSAELSLPHPRMQLRRFVLEPMAELAPEWHHPLSELTPSDMLALLDKP